MKTLLVFDFDETIVRVPNFSAKVHVEEPDLQFDEAYDFYDHHKSLCERSYNIQLVSPVYEAWRRGMDSGEAYSILITQRIEELSNHVKDILESRGVYLDDYFFLGRKSKKIDVVRDLISDMPSLKNIHVYEDSIREINEYQQWFKTLGEDGIDKKTFIVDKSRVYEIGPVTLSNEKQIRLI